MKNKLKINIIGIFIFFIFVSMLLLQMTSAVLMSDQGTDVKNKSSGETFIYWKLEYKYL